MKYNILIAEDDVNIIELMTLYFDSDEYNVFYATDGEAALDIVKNEDISVALVDIMMPKMNGYEFIKAVRKISNFPIIIISAKNLDEDEVLGLNLGADAYIKKPFNPLVVVANVKAVLRRTYQLGSANDGDSAKKYVVGDLVFNTETFVLTKNSKPLPLTMAELKIVAKLMSAPKRVFTKAQLYESINGDLFESDENTMMVHISNIRSKIEDNPDKPQYIKTVRGLGYKIDYKED